MVSWCLDTLDASWRLFPKEFWIAVWFWVDLFRSVFCWIFENLVLLCCIVHAFNAVFAILPIPGEGRGLKSDPYLLCPRPCICPFSFCLTGEYYFSFCLKSEKLFSSLLPLRGVSLVAIVGITCIPPYTSPGAWGISRFAEPDAVKYDCGRILFGFLPGDSVPYIIIWKPYFPKELFLYPLCGI